MEGLHLGVYTDEWNRLLVGGSLESVQKWEG